MRGVFFLGLADPQDEVLKRRMKRFAGLYMNEDPTAPNYDSKNKIIRSIWNGSKGPMLRRATVYDWVGDPVEGQFNFLHSGKRGQMLDFAEHYPKMLAHCADYLDSEGDNNLNLASTSLALNAFVLTGEKKYRDWVVEYVSAWRDRTSQNGGNIPSNIGLDGKIGGTYGGKWYKGTYGWNFTIFDGEIEQVGHRNYFTDGSWPGFGNAYLLTGDPSYIATLRRQMDNIYAQKRIENGRVLLPQNYGDPRGYKFSGQEAWYNYTGNLFVPRLTEIYLWSMDRKDLERVPKTGWIGFLEGQNAEYPVRALQGDLARIKRSLDTIARDSTTPQTRLADYLLNMNPVVTDNLTRLMLGGSFEGRIWTLHTRLRYFDPERKRPGMPEDVAALVENLTADSVTVVLVNLNATSARSVIVQAGGYREHQFVSAELDGKVTPIDAAFTPVRLAPGAGARITFKMKRYLNPPTESLPWIVQ